MEKKKKTLTASGHGHQLPGHGHLGKCHATLLTSGQTGHGPYGQLPRDSVASQMMPVLLLRLPCRNMSQQSYGIRGATRGPRRCELCGWAACARWAQQGRNSTAASSPFPSHPSQDGAAGLVTGSKSRCHQSPVTTLCSVKQWRRESEVLAAGKGGAGAHSVPSRKVGHLPQKPSHGGTPA